MANFKGFPAGKVRFTSLPDLFFTELLPLIDRLDELKVTLYAFWRLSRMEGAFRYLPRAAFLEDELFLVGLDEDPQAAERALDIALADCVQRGTFLKATLNLESGTADYYFLNTPKGRAAVQAIQRGEWRHSGLQEMPLEMDMDRLNVFQLYEENIGPLTPMIAEQLRDAENSYPSPWIEDAMRIAVENNVRRWSYVEAILTRWQEGGRDERTDRRDTEKDRRRYVEGEYTDIIEH